MKQALAEERLMQINMKSRNPRYAILRGRCRAFQRRIRKSVAKEIGLYNAENRKVHPHCKNVIRRKYRVQCITDHI